jgi:hypothetical protein
MEFVDGSVMQFAPDNSKSWIIRVGDKVYAVIGWAIVAVDYSDIIVDDEDEPKPSTEIQPVVIDDRYQLSLIKDLSPEYMLVPCIPDDWAASAE